MELEQNEYTVRKSNTPSAAGVEVGSSRLLSDLLKTVHLHTITNGQFCDGLAAESRGWFLF